MDEKDSVILRELDNASHKITAGYYTWFAIHVILIVLTVGLPAIASMGIFDGVWNKVLAGSAAITAAITHAVRPHEYATAYDAGIRVIWSTRVSFLVKSIDATAASEEIRKAIEIITFRYGGGSRSAISAKTLAAP